MAKMPRIGQLDKRVTLQQESQTPDGGGGYSLSWSDVATFWARVEPLSGQEELQAMSLEATITHRIWFRKRDDVQANMRITLGSRVFTVWSPPVNVDEADRFQYVNAEEGGPV